MPQQSLNGKRCFTCNGTDCSKPLACEGDETQCFITTGEASFVFVLMNICIDRIPLKMISSFYLGHQTLHQLFFFSQLTLVARRWSWKDVQARCSVGSTQHNLWDYPFRAMALAFTWNAVRETCVTLLTAWEFILWCWYLFSLYLCSDTCWNNWTISFAKHL